MPVVRSHQATGRIVLALSVRVSGQAAWGEASAQGTGQVGGEAPGSEERKLVIMTLIVPHELGPEPEHVIVRHKVLCLAHRSTEVDLDTFVYQGEWEQMGDDAKTHRLDPVRFRGHKLIVGAAEPRRLLIEHWLIGEEDVLVKPVIAEAFTPTAFCTSLDLPTKEPHVPMTMFLLSEIKQEAVISILGRAAL